MAYSSNIGQSVGIAVIDAWGIPARNEIHLRSYPDILSTFCFHIAQPVAPISLFRIGVYGYLLKALLRFAVTFTISRYLPCPKSGLTAL